MSSKLAVFDVDGTLLPGPGSERRFMSELLRARVLHVRQVASQFAFAARYGFTYGRHVFKKDKAYLVDLPVDDIQALGEQFVAEKLLPILYPVVRERLDWHLDAGERVCLLTGAPDFLARPLGRQLGVHEIHAARCAVRGNRFTMAPPASHPFGYEKLAILRRICTKHRAALGSVSSYADSGHDVPLLRASGYPVAVFPDRVLRAEATKRNWEIIDSGLGVPSLS